MHVIHARGVNEAYRAGLQYIKDQALHEETRNGGALVSPVPVTTVYSVPQERVLFDPIRDCNPFFHLMESVWMLAGRDDVAWIEQFNSKFGQFSDNGETFHGAYGKRLRRYCYFDDPMDGHYEYDEIDQLSRAIEMLRENPNDRRVVCCIFDPVLDLGVDSKDIPCNDTIKFDIRNGRLNMYVFNRSNDLIWGCCGSNAVHFSYFQEYVARCVGVPVGLYYQLSMNYHAYDATFNKCLPSLNRRFWDPYMRDVDADPMDGTQEELDDDFAKFTSDDWNSGANDYNTRFVGAVCLPLRCAYEARKAGENIAVQTRLVGQCVARDWRKACHEWIERRECK